MKNGWQNLVPDLAYYTHKVTGWIQVGEVAAAVAFFVLARDNYAAVSAIITAFLFGALGDAINWARDRYLQKQWYGSMTASDYFDDDEAAEGVTGTDPYWAGDVPDSGDEIVSKKVVY